MTAALAPPPRSLRRRRVARPAAEPPRARPPIPESELLRGLRAGEEDAYRRLVEEHGPRLLGVARRLVPAEEDAEDAVQSAWLCVLRSVDRFRGECRLSTWLHRVVLNAARMQRRTGMRYRAGTEAARRDAEGRGPRRTDDDALAWRAGREEERLRVRDALARVPAPEREPLRLHHAHGLALAEVAGLLRAPVRTLEYAVRRGRTRMRAMLDPAAGTARDPRSPHRASA
jgi:RNA polymerase sigma-70 factor (ECF subfamily)